MTKERKIQGTEEAWESGDLGRDETFAVPAEININQIDDALELQMISIRLQKSLIDNFKMIAKTNGIGYQTLMRQILTRFADCEMKRLASEYLSQAEEKISEQQEESRKACG